MININFKNISEEEKKRLKQVCNNLKQATDKMMEEMGMTEEEFMEKVRKIRNKIRSEED